MFDQLDQFAEPLRGMLDSPWLWLIVLLVSGLDALLPFMPSETTVVLVAVLIGPHPPLLALLAAVAAAGALAGDCLGYAVGRCAGPRATAWLLRRIGVSPAQAKSRAWGSGRARRRPGPHRARTTVERHAATLVIAGRFLPGGRVVAALSTGSVRFPLRRFVLLDAVGAGLWALFSTALGGLGGAALTDSPVKGLLLASGAGLVVAGCVACLRRRGGTGAPGGGTGAPVGGAVPVRPGPCRGVQDGA
ncbi:VTT domain-containing protein [Streptomyces sp. NPDC048483]|uniref:DedA family protein n=1 Tax=Streptomyces sp. NPDC048483 TaxID=3154927 RepID=UPI003436E121